MKSSLRGVQTQRPRGANPSTRRFRPEMETLEARCLLASTFLQTNLVSDVAGMAAVPDSHLLNPWGLTASPTSPLWVADNNGGVSTLYNGQGAIVPLVVTIPTETTGSLGSPTGTIFNTAGTRFNVGSPPQERALHVRYRGW